MCSDVTKVSSHIPVVRYASQTLMKSVRMIVIVGVMNVCSFGCCKANCVQHDEDDGGAKCDGRPGREIKVVGHDEACKHLGESDGNRCTRDGTDIVEEEASGGSGRDEK